MSNSQLPHPSTSTYTPLVQAMLNSVREEESVIERLLICAANNEATGVMNAAQELAAIRKAAALKIA